MVCRNPAVAAERARKRAELLAATEAELEKVKASVEGPRGRLRAAPAGQIGERAGKVMNKYKVAKHFTLTITDGTFAYERKTEQINQEAALDGLYAIRTTLPADQLGASAAVRAYKQLKMAERAFRTMKDTIEIRPIHHHLETRVRAHIFLCMLAYYVAFELHQRLPNCCSQTTPRSPRPTPSNPRPAPPPPAPRPPAPRPRTGTPRTPSATSSPTSQPSAATPSASAPPSTPSPASRHPPRSKPAHSSYSTSSSTSSQSHTSPQHPSPAPTRGIRQLTTENFRLDGTPNGRVRLAGRRGPAPAVRRG